MRARDFTEPHPSVSKDDRAADAVRLVAGQLPTLPVLDTDQPPYAGVPGSQLIQQLVPHYALEDPLIAAMIEDRTLAEVTAGIAGRTVTEWLPPRTCTGSDAGVLQAAALMARTGSPLVAVVERDGDQVRLVGALTAACLMERLIGEM